jgi:hypothetical protein
MTRPLLDLLEHLNAGELKTAAEGLRELARLRPFCGRDAKRRELDALACKLEGAAASAGESEAPRRIAA